MMVDVTVHEVAHATATITATLNVTAAADVLHGIATLGITPSAAEAALPINAERMLAWIANPERLDFVLDTWEVNYRKRARRDGEAAAKAWLWWQLTRTLAEGVIQLSPRVAAFVYLLRRIVSFLIGLF
jgi:hypothetical protein